MTEKNSAYYIDVDGTLYGAESVQHAIQCYSAARAALLMTQRMIDEALPKFDWGKSALDANAVQLLNYTPGEVARALALMSGDLK